VEKDQEGRRGLAIRGGTPKRNNIHRSSYGLQRGLKYSQIRAIPTEVKTPVPEPYTRDQLRGQEQFASERTGESYCTGNRKRLGSAQRARVRLGSFHRPDYTDWMDNHERETERKEAVIFLVRVGGHITKTPTNHYRLNVGGRTGGKRSIALSTEGLNSWGEPGD